MANSVLEFIVDEIIAVLSADVVEISKLVPRRIDKTTFAKQGIGNHRRDRLGSDNPFEGIFQMMRETLGGCAPPPAIGGGERHPVYVARKRRKPGLIGMRLARQRQRQERASAKSSF